MTIWSADNHIRHPWFDPQLKKRKHVACESPNSEESDEPDLRAPKRRRCSLLEHGLAQLSLYHSELPQSGLQVPTAREAIQTPEEYAMDADEGMGDHMASVLLPGCIEEPEEEIQEVQMKPSSWYELAPDRIVITDLDLFESEEEQPVDESGITINASLIEHIRTQAPALPADRSNHALVLYRPLSISNAGRQDETHKGPAMDAELMEIEN